MKRFQRERLYEHRSKLRSVPSVDPVYIQENLTQQQQNLFWLALIKAREKGYAFAWMSQGTIFVHKGEGQVVILGKITWNITLLSLNCSGEITSVSEIQRLKQPQMSNTLHLNVQSLKNKIDQLEAFTSALSIEMDVLMLPQTWSR